MISALLSALPQLLKLFNLIMAMVRDAEQRGIGRAEAVKEALEKAHMDIAAGNAAEERARADHAAHPNSDAGFDDEFKRSE